MAEGFLLIDKPGGWTSHDVVARCRSVLGERRVGHAGTLDPMATGLLVLGVGRATRLLRYVQEGAKRYVATAVFGVATDTLDAEGSILEREPMDFDRAELEAAAARFVGAVSQVPPMVSALKVRGERLYDLARRGIEVEREPRVVEIRSIEVLDFAPGPYPEARFEVVCGSGTYIRSLADDLGAALGGRAHLSDLRRTSIGLHEVDAAMTPDALAALDVPSDALLPLSAGVAALEPVRVDAKTAIGISNGVVFAAAAVGLTEPGTYGIVDDAGRLLATYASDGRRAKPEVVLA